MGQGAAAIREHYLRQLTELDQAVQHMGDAVLETMRSSLDTLDRMDVARAKELVENDNVIDRMRHSIEERAFTLIATQQPAASDLRLVMAASTVATELERIGDYCSGIAKIVLIMAAEPEGGSTAGIHRMAAITDNLLTRALEAFKARDIDVAAAVWMNDDEVDDLYHDVFQEQIEEMAAHKSTVRRGTYMLWVAHNVERMADRVTNIAESVAFVVTGDVAAFRDRLEMESVPG